MITEPKQAKLLIHGINSKRAMLNITKKLQRIASMHHFQNTASVTNSYMGMSIDLFRSREIIN